MNDWSLGLSQFETPCAVPLFRMIVRRTCNALRCYPCVDGPGEIGIFNGPTGFTRIIIKTFSFSRTLNPAFIHLQYETVRAFVNKRLGVHTGIKTKFQGFF